jgi:hypothetical protein
MSTFDWQDLLTRISKQILESGHYIVSPLYQYGQPPAEVLASGWLGYAGATEEQIVQAEKRLGATLPPSYRDFLKVSNGWRQVYATVGKLWSIEEVEWC